MLIVDMGERQLATAPDTSKLDALFLKKQMVRLKTEYQDVIILRHIEGLGIDEIAEILSKDPNNVRVTLHRAMNALRSLHQERDQK